ncbi:MAG: hypothetical protein K9M56_04245 [Victivallales bacterium]|nr:hypothetical protein [Victivallales bacterium]
MKVPTYKTDRVKKRKLPNTAYKIKATPENFGAGEKAAVNQDLYKNINRLADAVEIGALEVTNAVVDESVREAGRLKELEIKSGVRGKLNSINEETRGFMAQMQKTKNENSKNIYADTKKFIQQKYENTIKNLSPVEQEMFTAGYQRFSSTVLDKAWELQKKNVEYYNKETRKAQNYQVLQDAVAAPFDEQIQNDTKNTILANTIAESTGLPVNEKQLKAAEALDNFHTEVFNTILDNYPEHAKEYYEANQNEMIPSLHKDINKKIKKAVSGKALNDLNYQIDMLSISQLETLQSELNNIKNGHVQEGGFVDDYVSKNLGREDRLAAQKNIKNRINALKLDAADQSFRMLSGQEIIPDSIAENAGIKNVKELNELIANPDVNSSVKNRVVSEYQANTFPFSENTDKAKLQLFELKKAILNSDGLDANAKVKLNKTVQERFDRKVKAEKSEYDTYLDMAEQVLPPPESPDQDKYFMVWKDNWFWNDSFSGNDYYGGRQLELYNEAIHDLRENLKYAKNYGEAAKLISETADRYKKNFTLAQYQLQIEKLRAPSPISVVEKHLYKQTPENSQIMNYLLDNPDMTKDIGALFNAGQSSEEVLKIIEHFKKRKKVK